MKKLSQNESKPMSKKTTLGARSKSKPKDLTNYKKLDSIEDQDIDYSDTPEMDEAVWASAKVVDPGPKKAISIRVDEDVINWYKGQGGRYQRLMNVVLRRYMMIHQGSK